MEQWYSKVRNLRDESESPSTTSRFTRRVFYDLKRMKVKEKVKFKQRMGPEFENWVATLQESFANALITEILNDDEFWELTLKLTLNV
jgi:hypothetical protein